MAEIDVPDGVQAFNFWTLLIMARLWEEFPRPQFFYINSGTVFTVLVSRDQTVAGAQIGPDGRPQVELFFDTMNWLLAEGFVNGNAQNVLGGFTEVTLTTKGFSVLNQIPRSVASRPGAATEKSLGAQIREAAISHTASAAAGLIQRMLE
jgi:hypothetical protein